MLANATESRYVLESVLTSGSIIRWKIAGAQKVGKLRISMQIREVKLFPGIFNTTKEKTKKSRLRFHKKLVKLNV